MLAFFHIYIICVIRTRVCVCMCTGNWMQIAHKYIRRVHGRLVYILRLFVQRQSSPGTSFRSFSLRHSSSFFPCLPACLPRALAKGRKFKGCFVRRIANSFAASVRFIGVHRARSCTLREKSANRWSRANDLPPGRPLVHGEIRIGSGNAGARWRLTLFFFFFYDHL